MSVEGGTGTPRNVVSDEGGRGIEQRSTFTWINCSCGVIPSLFSFDCVSDLDFCFRLIGSLV